MADIKKQNAEAALKAAEKLGFENIKDLEASVASKLATGNVEQVNEGKALARKTVEELTMLILYQEIQTVNLRNLDFANRFEDGYISEGNAKQYIINNPTGVDTYKPELFIPSEFTKTDVEEYPIQMYSANGTLNKDQAYQFRKEKTFMETTWIPYFKSGTLSTFVSMIRAEVQKVFQIFKYHNIMEFLTKTMVDKVKGKRNTITGTAPDLFMALSDEVLPLLRELLTQNTKYNYSENSKFINMVAKEDLVVLVNPRIKEKLSSGIQSQTYNAHLIDLKKIISDENMPEVGRKFNIPADLNSPITITDEFYVPEDTIIIFDRTMMKHVYQLMQPAVQSFAGNLSTTVQYHVWGARDYLPWGTFIVYKNENLKKIPSGKLELE